MRAMQPTFTAEQAQAIFSDGQAVLDVLNKEIARELLLEDESTISTERIDQIWAACNGNPWNSPILHQLLKGANIEG